MPYTSVKALPLPVKSLPPIARVMWMRAFNSAYRIYKDDIKAFKVAWAAVKQKYKKDANGKWVKR